VPPTPPPPPGGATLPATVGYAAGGSFLVGLLLLLGPRARRDGGGGGGGKGGTGGEGGTGGGGGKQPLMGDDSFAQDEPPSIVQKLMSRFARGSSTSFISSSTGGGLRSSPPFSLGPGGRLVVMGQATADPASVLRVIASSPPFAGSAEPPPELFPFSDADLVHPLRHKPFAALLQQAQKAQKADAARRRRGGEGGRGKGAAAAAACGMPVVVIVFDSAGERLPLLGRYGKLAALHDAVLAAGVPAARVAWVGTRERSADARVFTRLGQLTDVFRTRVGEPQVAELARHGYLPGRFFVWQGNAPEPQQLEKFARWLGGCSVNAPTNGHV
jgi:hypothetical protein